MSHNQIKVNSVSPGPDPNIQLSLNQFSEFNSTLNPGDALVWDSATGKFIGTPLTGGGGVGGAVDDKIFILGQIESFDYTACGYTFTTGNPICFYDANPYNSFPSGKITPNSTTLGTNSDFYESITLASGKYEIYVQIDADFTADGFVGYKIVDNNNNDLTETYEVMKGAYYTSTSALKNQTILTTINLPVTTTIKVVIESTVNVAATQALSASRTSSILIRSAE